MTQSHGAQSLPAVSSLLDTRASRAVLGHLALRSDVLREYLRECFSHGAGEDGSFLADPVVEAGFGYELADRQFAEFVGDPFERELIRALDQPPREFREHRFPSDRRPYTHQVLAWRAATDPKIRGYIVSSGTGSGKTECFLLPILDELVKQARTSPITGVRALFIYPLNALINSQRDRLRAWTRTFDGAIRYCLYNGETPTTVPIRNQQPCPEEVLSRTLLRVSPPPILVTNATMLEYMLVRKDDAPIIQQSRGLLRWVIVDEAHTYIGSQAAELSMLLRRVLDAFGVDKENVKFVATSATVASDQNRDRASLAQFLADLAGTKPNYVAVIRGKRTIPALPAEVGGEMQTGTKPVSLVGLDPADAFDRLRGSRPFLALRDFIAEKPRRMLHIASRWAELNGSDRRWSRADMLRFLDSAARAQKGGESLLPLRVHFFHRTQNGVWACLNATCAERKGSLLDNGSWPFGRTFLTRREECSVCGGRVFEVVHCVACGSVYLIAAESSLKNSRYLTPVEALRTDDELEDEFELVDPAEETDADASSPPSDGFSRLISLTKEGEWATEMGLNVRSGEILHGPEGGQIVTVILRDEDEALRCATCGSAEKVPGTLFRPLRMGAPYLLNVAVPTLLEQTPPMERSDSKPLDGRRVITFSDSRQGTAKFAVRSQLDADRNHVRSAIFHQLLANRRKADALEAEKLKKEIGALEDAGNSALKDLITERKRKLEEALARPIASVSWKKMSESLEKDLAIRELMPSVWDHVSFGEIRKVDFGEFCVLRELMRRPRRQNSLETLGLVGLTYPWIDQQPDHRTPKTWLDRALTPNDWRSLLTAIVDHFIRSRSAVDVPKLFLNWLGVGVRTMYVIAPQSEKTRERQVLWPQAASRRSTIPQLIATALNLDLSSVDDQRLVDTWLELGWEVIRPMLKQFADGYLIDLSEQAKISEVSQPKLCPITGRLIHNAFRHLTPYLSQFSSVATVKCAVVEMPEVPFAWWQESSGRTWSSEDIQAWLETDERAVDLRRRGIWTHLHDRVVAVAPYFRVVEHSAQQDGGRLREFEDKFRNGEINVMSCSTTMELGVDVGGISAVAMNNAPPSPSNFLQRAGRAGRRGEPITVSLTLCKADPHGEAVFANPLWPFETPLFVPRVSLDSNRLIQRHVNAFLLSEYLRTAVDNDPPRLTAGWFFGEGKPSSPADAFRSWCVERVVANEKLSSRLKTLMTGARLEKTPGAEVVNRTAEHLFEIKAAWTSELWALDSDISRFTISGSTPSPAQLSAMRQRERLVNEYLLRELTSRGFLPGYGFPSDVVPFIPTTLKQLRRERLPSDEREDSMIRRRGYPSRELQLAIRDYAPGNQIVLDGRVYESSGVTLNWHIPPGDQAIRETQVFGNAWFCRICGATGSSKSEQTVCTACQASAGNLTSNLYLQPAGFAVDIAYQPHNRVSSHLFVPVEEPWISAGDARWSSLEIPIAARFRSSHAGHVFHFSRGLYRRGFAICLRCGRAASESPNDSQGLPRELREHNRLRGGKDQTGESRCEGNDEAWGIKRSIWLGVSAYTDVFELQLLHPTGDGASLREAAFSTSIAMRTALTSKLGIDTREIGCAAIPARGDEDERLFSIVLFDQASNGAGYSTLAVDDVPDLIAGTLDRLQCSCDAACHRCLLSYETQHKVKHLNRFAAIEYLRQR